MRPSWTGSRSPAVMAADRSRGWSGVAGPGARPLRQECSAPPPGQHRLSRRSVPARRPGRRARCVESDGEALAALGAAGVDHATAATALHANEEAVRTGATDFGRLIGALHD